MSTCQNCGSTDLVKAHLIPRAFCVEVQVGKSHASAITRKGDFQATQSGIWDRTILCGRCDGILGDYEGYAVRIAQQIRESAPKTPGERGMIPDVDTTKFLRFCAGILYKYSITARGSRIKLGRYQDVLREFLYDPRNAAPRELDAFVLRPLRHDGDTGVFAYREPILDRQNGTNIYRMMMGGLIVFVHLDRRSFAHEKAEQILVKSQLIGLAFDTVNAAHFEEFRIPARLAQENQKLSDYLERVERT